MRVTGRRRFTTVLMALLAAFTLIAASCGDDDEDAGADIKACEVTDTGGVDDRSFNETAYAGVTQAEEELGVTGEVLESQDATDFQANIDSFIDQECDLIITVGFLLGDDTLAAAEDNPDQQFAIVDYAYEDEIPNIRPLVFDTDQAAFLAGYAAAAMTKTGTVGMFGGIEIPTVTIFMDGFQEGVEYFNEQKDGDVKVIGRDLFTGNFESTDDGRAFAENLIDEGADIIMPVAGPVGLGAAAVAQDRGDVMIIGVDSDWFESASEYSDVIFTSVMKKMDTAVFDSINNVVESGEPGEIFIGTLENEGVDIAPFHDFEDDLPDGLIDELDEIRAGIIDGSITVGT